MTLLKPSQLILCATFWVAVTVAVSWAEQEYAPGQLIIKYKESVSAAAYARTSDPAAPPISGALAALQQRHGRESERRLFADLDRPGKRIKNRADLLSQVKAAVKRPIKDLGPYPNVHDIYLVTFKDKAMDMEQAARELRNDPAIEYAHPDYLMQLAVAPNDTYYAQQWAHGALRLNSEAGWALNTGTASVVIAVVDTGIDLTHPDLTNNLFINTAEAGANSINGVDDDANGFIDDVCGWNFAQASAFGNTTSFLAEDYTLPTNYPKDTEGHGTIVSGIAAAAGNNGIGVAGTAWGCKIMPMRVALTQRPQPGLISTVYMTSSWVASGIHYAANNGAQVINLSISDNNWPSAIKSAIDAAYALDVVLAGAAGNEAESVPTYPAAYEKVIAVGATDQNDQRAIWGVPVPPLYHGSATNYGSWIDVAAPGSSVYTTHKGSAYGTDNGTSLSTPFVAGLAGLIRSQHPEFTNEEVMKVIYSTTDPVISDQYIGTGRINLRRALEMTAVPVAEINTPTSDQTLAVTLPIEGSAGGANFSSYTLKYGQRFYPSVWTTIATSSTPVTNGTLATWDLSAVTDNLPYTLRLSVTDTAGNVSISEKIVYVQKNVQPGWPKIMGNFFYGNENGDCIAVGDINRDGTREIAVVSKRLLGGPNQTYDLHVYHQDGNAVMGWPRTDLNRYMSSPTIADINHTGDRQIVVPGENWGTPNSTTKFHIFSANGSYYPGWPKLYTSTHEILPHTPSVGDIDNDGHLEMVFPSQRDSSGFLGQHAYIFVYRFDGSTLPGWPKEINLNFPEVTSSADQQASHACLVDLNGDNALDIVCGVGFYNESKIFVWDYHGNTLPGWPQLVGDEFTPTPVAGDIDQDGDMELVASAGKSLFALTHTGTPCPGAWPVALPLGIGPPVMADLDGDGTLEIVVYCHNHRVYAFNHGGSLLPGWPVSVTETFIGGERPNPILADIDGNDGGRPEVIYAAGENENIYAWNADGTPVAGWPKVIPGVAVLSPVVADMDNDGNADMVVAYNFNTLDLWALNVPYNASASAWPMSWFNSNHTATYTTDITAPMVQVTGPPHLTIIEGTIGLTATASDDVGVIGVRFQIDGVLVGEPMTAGPYTLLWSSVNTPNGIHQLTALAWDLAGNRTVSAPVTITIDNPDIFPPSVFISDPEDGATVSGTVTVSASAEDTGMAISGVDRVQFQLDGVDLGAADSTYPYSVVWDTRSIDYATHVLTAYAWDVVGNSAVSAGISVTVNNLEPTPTPNPADLSIVNAGEIKIVGSTGAKGVVRPSVGEKAQIYFKGNAVGTFEIRVFNLAGEQVFHEKREGISEAVVVWEAKDMPSGIYLAVVRGPGINAQKKIAILR